MSPTVESKVRSVRARIEAALTQSGRPKGAVALIGVAKGHPAEVIRAAAAAGVADIGESYVSEGVAKHDALAGERLRWHFVGPLQSNKTRAVAERFDWVHSVDRERIGRRLAAQRPDHADPLDVCVQVNIDGEATKSGVTPEAAPDLVAALGRLPALRVRGLMAIPAPRASHDAQREPFRRLATLLGALREHFGELPLDTLSMGMSDDLEAAIAEGATMVRIGTALFGPRETRPREETP